MSGLVVHKYINHVISFKIGLCQNIRVEYVYIYIKINKLKLWKSGNLFLTLHHEWTITTKLWYIYTSTSFKVQESAITETICYQYIVPTIYN